MGKYDLALKKIQEARLEKSTRMSGLFNDYDKGVITGLEKAENILYSLQQDLDGKRRGLWYTGTPNDIKPDNRGTFVLIMRAGFDSDDGVTKGNLYIDTDFWDGEQWESYEIGEDKWTILYFTKLKWLKFPLPEELGVKKTDSMFFN